MCIRSRHRQDTLKELVSVLSMEQEMARAEIGQTSEMGSHAAPPIYLSALPTTRPSFFGRRRELAEMSKILDLKSAGQKSVVLCSAGDFGKTKLALQYIEIEQTSYDFILWVNASTPKNTAACFAEAASCLESLKLAPNSSPTPASEASRTEVSCVKSWLENAPHTWLMVLDSLDGVDNCDTLALLPKCDRGRIIVTTTRMDVARSLNAQILEISGLDIDSGADLLLDKVNLSTRSIIAHDDAKFVVDQLSGIPLAIEQAGALLSSGFSIDDFRTYFSSKYREKISKKPATAAWPSDKTKSVFETFEVLHDVLAKTDPNGVNLLALLSFLGPGEVPVVIFQSLGRLQDLEEDFQQQEDSSIRAEESWFYEKFEWLKTWCADDFSIFATAIRLKKFCLIKSRRDSDESASSLTVHNALCQWTRERQVPKDAAAWCLIAAYVLSHHLARVTFESGDRAAENKISTLVHFAFSCMEQYIYHGSVVSSKENFCHLNGFISKQFGIHFYRTRQLAEAKKALLDAMDYSRTKRSQQWLVEKSSLELVATLRDTYWELGEWENAQDLNFKLLALDSIKSGLHDDIGADAAAMAQKIRHRLNVTRGATKRAIRGYLQSKTSSEQDEKYLDVLGNLVKAFTQNLVDYGENDIFTLEARLHLAQFYEGYGEYADALDHLEKICGLFPVKYADLFMFWGSRLTEIVSVGFWSLFRCKRELDDAAAFRHELQNGTLRFAIHFAVVSNDERFMKRLVEEGSHPDSKLPADSWSVLHLACVNSNMAAIKLILASGADVNLRNNFGRTALDVAVAFNRQEEIIQMLLDAGAAAGSLSQSGAYVDQKYSPNIITPLLPAIMQSEVSAAASLVEQEADISARDSYDRTALHFAAYQPALQKASNEQANSEMQASEGITNSLRKRQKCKWRKWYKGRGWSRSQDKSR